jgi:hypothetical protein
MSYKDKQKIAKKKIKNQKQSRSIVLSHATHYTKTESIRDQMKKQ